MDLKCQGTGSRPERPARHEVGGGAAGMRAARRTMRGCQAGERQDLTYVFQRELAAGR